MAQNKDLAIEMEEMLGREGILVKVREVTKKRSDAEGCFELLVPEAEIEEAHSVIVEKGY
jgi:hypothetical protein